jgi:hypothetical protein
VPVVALVALAFGAAVVVGGTFTALPGSGGDRPGGNKWLVPAMVESEAAPKVRGGLAGVDGLGGDGVARPVPGLDCVAWVDLLVVVVVGPAVVGA